MRVLGDVVTFDGGKTWEWQGGAIAWVRECYISTVHCPPVGIRYRLGNLRVRILGYDWWGYNYCVCRGWGIRSLLIVGLWWLEGRIWRKLRRPFWKAMIALGLAVYEGPRYERPRWRWEKWETDDA